MLSNILIQMVLISAFRINMMRIERQQFVNARCDTKQVSAGYNPALRIHLRTYPSRSLYLPEFNLQSLFLIQAPSAICRQDQSGSKRKNRRSRNQCKHNAAIPRFGQASFWIAANIGVIYNRRLVFDRRCCYRVSTEMGCIEYKIFALDPCFLSFSF